MASTFELERARKQQELGVVPYDGVEPFIFISYAHRDYDRVLPVVKALMDHGFRVWYDEGIDPGSEWDVNIAAHVESCHCMLSFLSKNYLASDNCLDELSYARDLKKQQLFVYLDALKLPGGLALRFGRLQAIHKYSYPKDKPFYDKLFSASVMELTWQAPMPSKVAPAEKQPAATQKAVSAEKQPSVTPKVVPATPRPAASSKTPAVRHTNLQAIAALFEYVKSGDSITITKLKDKSRTEVEIPWGVTGIGENAFEDCTDLISISIPDSVASIGYSAFFGCDSLNSITIPNSVTRIEGWAFNGCRSLTSITIPDGVTLIEEDTFSDCSNLTSITIPNSVTGIDDGAFSWCESLTSITIPNNVTHIADYAFNNCSSLTDINIPDSVTEIGDCAFQDCAALKCIIIPESVTSIWDDAFIGCTNLTIYGWIGSCAEQHAADQGIPFVAI